MMEQKSSRKQNEANLRKEGISEATNLKSLKELIAGEPIKNYMKNEKPDIERYKAAVYKISDDLTTKENKLHQISKQLEGSQNSRKEKIDDKEKLQEKVATTKEDIQTIKEKIAKREKSFLHKLFKGPYNTLTKELHLEEKNLHSNQLMINVLSTEIKIADESILHLEKVVKTLKKEINQMQEDISGASNILDGKINELQSGATKVKTARKIAAKYPQVKRNAQPARSGR
ncbi:hypothetical protein PMU66_07880 [Enterococcus durans]|uniref:hypothetical protein n=1 Tax=Enterococcus durans TaxID=53345 RepID=UPI00232F0E71|nr:hypothetical protein [Enterococcus durans]MDB1653702.1 hypothetical protein [Enterococcus durans]MDB1654942.1 hypothetical protein [Enterococcus durans]MDB1664014.1 hypothetical protein [Enterococcus durans]MDB1670224.1 hypothetical protein [Enterococcus durans]MDB1672125.1 hypothetical protein [Enterococcus durans]